jgi:XRE family transcriptional regulator, fatty acid utilization regulator
MNLAERLKKARLALNLTLGMAEELTKIGSSTLSEFENGKREPRLPQLKRLADAYQRSLGFFLEDEEPAVELVLWRKKPNPPQVEHLQRRLLTLAEQYHNLEVWCDNHQPCALPLAGGKPDSYSYADAEKLAYQVRHELGLGERPGQTLLRVLEEVCNVKVFHIPFEPTGSAACTLNVKFGAAVLLNSKHVRWRRNFDLAHEFFHLLTWGVFRQPGVSDGVEASEWEEKLATCFARNLLMPQEALRVAVDPRLDEHKKLGFDALFEVARQFDVSVEALLWQMGFVYRIASDKVRDHVDRYRTQMAFWDNRERDDPSERPLRFCALARQALRHGLISAGRYAEYLGITRREAMQVVEQDAEQDAEVEVVDS